MITKEREAELTRIIQSYVSEFGWVLVVAAPVCDADGGRGVAIYTNTKQEEGTQLVLELGLMRMQKGDEDFLLLPGRN